jgi:hypothetical protein
MTKRIKPENGWAIAGDCGFYTGWFLTRSSAIADHVQAIYGYSERNSKLSAQQEAAWQECRRKGDRAVKITISQRR